MRSKYKLNANERKIIIFLVEHRELYGFQTKNSLLLCYLCDSRLIGQSGSLATKDK
jgi:hypothetical protein